MHGHATHIPALRRPILLAVLLTCLALLVGCGSDESTPETALPGTLTLQVPARGEPGSTLALGSSLGTRGADLRFQWDFGDGSTSTQPQPVHAYAAPGRYRVVLQVSNAAGESRRAESEVLVRRFSFVEQASCLQADRSGWCRQWPQDAAPQVVPLSYAGNLTAWGAGSDGGLYRTEAADAAWQAVPIDTVSRRILHIGFDTGQTVGWALGVAADAAGVPSRGVLVLKTTDGGRTWARQALPASWDVPRVEAGWLKVLSPTHVIIGHQDEALVSADGGASWRPTRANYTAFGRSGTTVWSAEPETASAGARLRRSTDLGVSFETVLTLATGESIQQVIFLDERRGWVAVVKPADAASGGGVDVLFTTADGGASWQDIGGAGLERPATGLTLGGCPAPRFQFADGSRGTAGRTCVNRFGALSQSWRTVDGGRSWNRLPQDNFCPTDLQLDAAGAAWTAGRCPSLFPVPESRRAYLSRDLGLQWTTLEVPDEAETSPVLSVSLAADGAILVRHAARTYRSADLGATWQRVKDWPAAPPAASAQHALAFTSASVGHAVGTEGRLMTTRDGGRQWQPQGLVVKNAGRPTGRIDFVTPDVGWILGDSRLYRTADGGRQWTEVLADGAFFVRFDDVIATGPQQLWSASAALGLYTSTDGARTWRQPAGAGSLGFRALGIRFADARRGVAVGEGGGIAYTTDAGERWQRADAGTTSHLRRVYFSDASTAWAVGAGGTVRVSRDAGATWQPVVVDAPFAWNGVFFVNAQVGWIVGDYGSIAATRDGGRTWARQASGTGAHLYDVVAADAQTVWAVGERGVLHASVSGGD